MDLAPDLAAFLATLLRGGWLTAQALTVGGIVFTLVLARPLLAPPIQAAVSRWTARAALGLAGIAVAGAGLTLSQLVGRLGIPLAQAIGADFVQWDAFMASAALAAAVIAPRRLPSALLAASGLAMLAASAMTSHAAARLDDRPYFIVADVLHQAGASAWIGGIPFLLLALARVDDGDARLRVGGRFSRIAAAGVALLAAGAMLLALGYIGSGAALVGTAYGAMVVAKAQLLGLLLLLGLMNLLSVRAGDAPLARLRRFAEVEIGIGVSVLFIAASLASQPPAVEQTADRATVAEIAQRMEPVWPRLSSPPHAMISIPSSATGSVVNQDADRAWSEFNHHWAGLFVLAIGGLGLMERGGWRRARHWPLAFLGLAAMLFVRSDPESWPLGPIPFFARLADPEVMQHRLLTLVIAVFGLFEWAARTGRLAAPRARLVFPLLCAVGGALLLAHSHSLTDVKQRYLIELTHIPMGLLGIVAGWARWLELRGDGWPARTAGWVWPGGFLLIGLLLLNYRES